MEAERRSAKEVMIALAEALLESPKNAVFFSVDNQIQQSDQVLAENDELCLKTEKLVTFFKGVLNFPVEYIKIKVS